MSKEGNQIINRMPGNFDLAPVFVNNRSVDITSRKQMEKFHPATAQFLQLFLSLIGENNCQTPVVLTYPHSKRRKKQKAPSDMVELSIPTSKHNIVIYGNESGNFYFSIIDNSNKANGTHDKKIKVSSTKEKLSDAMITKQVFKDTFEAIGCHSVSVDGPSDNEPFVVMTRFRSPSIAQSVEGDVLGLVFKQIADPDTRIVHGKVQFLVRKKMK